MSYSYRPIYIGCTGVLFYKEKTSMLWKITFIAGLISVIGNIIFIPIYGVNAAALITFISLLYMGFAGFMFDAVKANNKANLKPSMWFIINVLSLLIVCYTYSYEVNYKILINIILLMFLGGLLIKNGYKIQ